MPISQTEGYFENPYYRFLEEPMLFLRKSVFPSVKAKTNPDFVVKLAERNNHSFLRLFDEPYFSNICTLNT